MSFRHSKDFRLRKPGLKVEALLSERGLLEKVEATQDGVGQMLPVQDRRGSRICRDQWFVKIKPLAEPAIKAVEDGRIRIIPEAWINNYLGWMRDIKDWCVSRQIWWGHQIPAWYCETCYGKPFLRRASDGAPSHSDRRATHCRKNQTVGLPSL